ncbi:accessory gene regulator ArgB-like protein [Paenibacillus polymyxa]|uniref:accessory gene regulator ArgB-like protein n=1 Tax=Paenibacillus polymyxa TaxID=1406 RepID=UPI00049513EF|nr:accessory gene regulator B family protein [Paenibacillus polymyxa]
MIDKLADDISNYLKNKYPEELPSTQIVRYSMKFVISNLLPIIIVLFASLFLNNTYEVMITLISFSSLRMFSGGFHFRSAEACIVFSSLTIIVISKIAIYLNDHTFLMFLVSLALVLIYAPSNIEKQTRVKEKNFIWFKIISLSLVAIIYAFDNPISNFAVLVQCLLLIRLKGGE